MAAEQRVNEDLERDVEARLASMVRTAKADARSAAATQPAWTPREWTAAASGPADFTEAAPLDLAKVRAQRRPPETTRVGATVTNSPRARLLVKLAVLLFVVALAIAVLAALGLL